MVKKIFLMILVSILLTSCISITKDVQDLPTQNFVTATLIPTQAQLIPATSTVTPQPSATPAPTATSLAKCTDAAILLRDVTIQDDTQVKAGEKFTKTWEFQNTGTCPWNNYTFKFSSGDSINAPLSPPIADTPPNGKVQASVELTAPTADGRYADYFSLLNSNREIIPIGTQKTFWVRFVVGTYVAVSTTPSSSPTPSGNCIHSPNANYVNEIVSLINAARTNAGLQTLTFNTQIAEFSQHHAEDMAFNNFLSHDGSDGTFGERMAGYSMTHTGSHITGEILAIGTPQNAIEQWQKDEHWNYILGAFTQLGAGYAYNSCSDFSGYFTVDFQ